MFIRFVVSNFLSFEKETEFNMLAESLKMNKHHVYKAGKVDVLKATAIYGANGAGKSNLIKAISFLKNLVSAGKLSSSIDNQKFKLNASAREKPTELEIEFSVAKKIYRYGIVLNHNIVLEEWLYESGVTTDDKLIFERKTTPSEKVKIEIRDKYKKTSKEKLLIKLMEENLLKSDELFLSKFGELKIQPITESHQWITNNLIIVFPTLSLDILFLLTSNSDNFRKFLTQVLPTFETGSLNLKLEDVDLPQIAGEVLGTIVSKKFIKQVFDSSSHERLNSLSDSLINNLEEGMERVVRTNDGDLVSLLKKGEKLVARQLVAVHADHQGRETSFKLSEESDGTRRLFDLMPFLFILLNHNGTIFIDEIDRSLHPSLIVKLLEKFTADESTKGQLVVTTHESNLLNLEIFRQDEIWFAEKDGASGSTHLYSLSEFKPRYDLDIRKGYLNGRFGAIPFLANLQDLNWHTEDAEEARV